MKQAILLNAIISLFIGCIVSACSNYMALPSSKPLSHKDDHLSKKALSKNNMLLGVYSPTYLGSRSSIKKQLVDLDSWAGKKHSLAGIFMDLETQNPHFDIPAQAELLYEYGYTPFFNLTSQRSAKEIIAGKVNENIYNMGAAFANLLKKNPQQKILIAPLPEMNGFWEAYGEDPKHFLMAYHQIRDLFFQAGVPKKSIYWVFAPNGWSNKGHEFERYYPGDESTDAVAYSSYNFGFCAITDWPKWQNAKSLHADYIQRFKKITGKPIIVGQTATTAITGEGYNIKAKNEWLKENYDFLSSAGNVMGVMYFNIQKECDWAVHTGKNKGVPGYQKAIQKENIGYAPPQQIKIFFGAQSK